MAVDSWQSICDNSTAAATLFTTPSTAGWYKEARPHQPGHCAPGAAPAVFYKAEQTKTQLFQWLGFRSRSVPAPGIPSLGAAEGGVS